MRLGVVRSPCGHTLARRRVQPRLESAARGLWRIPRAPAAPPRRLPATSQNDFHGPPRPSSRPEMAAGQCTRIFAARPLLRSPQTEFVPDPGWETRRRTCATPTPPFLAVIRLPSPPWNTRPAATFPTAPAPCSCHRRLPRHPPCVLHDANVAIAVARRYHVRRSSPSLVPYTANCKSLTSIGTPQSPVSSAHAHGPVRRRACAPLGECVHREYPTVSAV
ncbi:uncharacterized protein TRAVEDRAFT_32535 [Trametes versicolor FP-101664 SS1]|uniref:Uncharacterized protein n=1 Tax=Trametes versicolor (strain FP-101664) TaxID=717944 RepID=R7S6T4_TRAVS|nr:uncharacterized protein TRAVEDRAFT_32535 [Trametes versicolor FP-101664 SS1]EIW51277.1 hypothetical protein TRAVEDRAFT_32535 [Trametes versicolor FP-101664 SS1]